MGEVITIPLDEYRRLQTAAETLEDISTYDRVIADIDAGHEETMPAMFARRIIAGESPLRIWREYRGLSQVALAATATVNRVQIADIEAGRKTGSVETVKKLAAALGVMIDDLV